MQRKRIRLGTMRLQVRSLALLSGLRIWRCRELWCRLDLVLLLLWLWCRPAAVALIQPLPWETPYAEGAALKSKKKKIYIYIYMIQENVSEIQKGFQSMFGKKYHVYTKRYILAILLENKESSGHPGKKEQVYSSKKCF